MTPNDPKLSDCGARRAGCGRRWPGAGWAQAAGWCAAASVTRGAVRCSAWFGDFGCSVDSLIAEVGCVLLPKRVASRRAAKPEASIASLIDFADHLDAVERGVEREEDMTCGVETFKAVDNLEGWRRRPIVVNELDDLLNGFVVIGKRIEDEPVMQFD